MKAAVRACRSLLPVAAWLGTAGIVPAVAETRGHVKAAETTRAPGRILPAAPVGAAVPALAIRIRSLAETLWPEAETQQIARSTFDAALAGLSPDNSVLELVASQPEYTIAPWDYIDRLAADSRIQLGRQKLEKHRAPLAEIEARYGVPPQILVSIWGIESSFGTSTGQRQVIRSLATLAAGDGRRTDFWRSELLEALKIVQRGDIAVADLKGSWAGAMGHTQFMPSSYRRYAVDFDQDGRRDIWNSITDALASSANYLKSAGWRTGMSWGFEVILPVGFEFHESGPDTARTLGQWRSLGVSRPAGLAWPDELSQATLLLPAGSRGPAFLVGRGFKAILSYNNAVPYALAVALLADRMVGGPPINGSWPLDDPPIPFAQRKELQRRLAALGLDPGPIDGIVGDGTRGAVRAYQHLHELPADGWTGRRLLAHIREMEKNANPTSGEIGR